MICMPQFVWEGVFSILNVLVPGVTLAIFAVYYQNRRKREIQIEGELAVSRIDGYEQILTCFYEGQDVHEVSLREEEAAKAILGYFDAKTFRYQCPNAFKNEADFDAFYTRLTTLQRDYQIFLDDEASRQLDSSVEIYSRFKSFMDAFCDTVHTKDLNVDKDVAREHIDMMYRLMGMVMFSHCTRAYVELERVVRKQMNRFYLTYRRHRVRKWFRNFVGKVLYVVEVNSKRKGVTGKICRGVIALCLGREERNFAHLMTIIVEVMRYVHFSDRFTPKEYFEGEKGPSDEELELYRQVFMAMLHGA